MNDEDEVINRAGKIMRQYGESFIDDGQENTGNLDEDDKAETSNLLMPFIIALVSAGGYPLSKLTTGDIETAVDMLDFTMPPDDNATAAFNVIVRFGYLFLGWLAMRGDINLTLEQIADTFEKLASDQQPVPGDFDDLDDIDDLDYEDPDREIYHYDRPGLPEYQERTAGRIRETATDLAEELVDSGKLKPIIGQVGEVFEDDIISALTDLVSHLYGEYRRTPPKWTKKALKGVLTGYLIKDAWIRPNEYPQVGAILKSFMTFAAENRFVSKQIADRMRRAIDEVEPEMIRLGSDKRHFSEEKRNWLASTAADHVLKDDAPQFSNLFDDQPLEAGDSDAPVAPTESGSEGRVISLSQWKKQNKKKKKKPKKR